MSIKEKLFTPCTDEERKASEPLASDWLAKIGKEVKARPKRWLQGEMARNKKGESVPPDDPRAVCWCIEGFLHRDYKNFGDKTLGQIRQALYQAKIAHMHYTSIFAYSDTLKSVDEFLNWLRESYKIAKAMEKK